MPGKTSPQPAPPQPALPQEEYGEVVGWSFNKASVRRTEAGERSAWPAALQPVRYARARGDKQRRTAAGLPAQAAAALLSPEIDAGRLQLSNARCQRWERAGGGGSCVVRVTVTPGNSRPVPSPDRGAAEEAQGGRRGDGGSGATQSSVVLLEKLAGGDDDDDVNEWSSDEIDWGLVDAMVDTIESQHFAKKQKLTTQQMLAQPAAQAAPAGNGGGR